MPGVLPSYPATHPPFQSSTPGSISNACLDFFLGGRHSKMPDASSAGIVGACAPLIASGAPDCVSSATSYQCSVILEDSE